MKNDLLRGAIKIPTFFLFCLIVTEILCGITGTKGTIQERMTISTLMCFFYFMYTIVNIAVNEYRGEEKEESLKDFIKKI